MSSDDGIYDQRQKTQVRSTRNNTQSDALPYSQAALSKSLVYWSKYRQLISPSSTTLLIPDDQPNLTPPIQVGLLQAILCGFHWP